MEQRVRAPVDQEEQCGERDLRRDPHASAQEQRRATSSCGRSATSTTPATRTSTATRPSTTSELGLFCYARLAAGAFRSTGRADHRAAAGRPGAPPAGGPAGRRRARPRHARAAPRRGHRRPAAEGVVRTFGPNQGLLEGRVLSIGTVQGLTILVNFQDVVEHRRPAPTSTTCSTATTTPATATSARRASTSGASPAASSTTRNVVVGPVPAQPRTAQFYVNNLLVEEALELAVADGLDLTQFDSRDEGIVDALNVLYAGQTQYHGDLWPHNCHIDLRFGAMRTDLYLLTSLGRTAADLSIGTFCHENGHLLCRFPDMYDYGERDGDSVGERRHRQLLPDGLGQPPRLRPQPVAGLRLPARPGRLVRHRGRPERRRARTRPSHGDYDTVHEVPHQQAQRVLPRREPLEDGARPGRGAGSGLAVYHCDILGSNELQQGTATQHYQCALLQADGRRDLELERQPGRRRRPLRRRSRAWRCRRRRRRTPASGTGAIPASSSPTSRARAEPITFSVGQASAGGRPSPARPTPDWPSPTTTPRASPARSRSPASASSRRSRSASTSSTPSSATCASTLTSPAGRTAVLHAQLGGSRDDLVATYDSASPGVLAEHDRPADRGDWTLSVVDQARRDVGTLRTWRLDLSDLSDPPRPGGHPTSATVARQELPASDAR